MTLEPKDNEIRRIFALFDTEKNGKVSTEVLPTLIRAFSQNPTKRDVQKYLADVDPNKTGFFDYTEFSTALLKRWRDPTAEEAQLMEAFEEFDKTKSGYIKIRDMCGLLKQIGDGLSTDEANEFTQLCETSGFMKGDAVGYRAVCRLLAIGETQK